MFNDGNAAGCAAEYETALKDVVDSLSGLPKVYLGPDKFLGSAVNGTRGYVTITCHR